MPGIKKDLCPENSPWLAFFQEVRRLADKLDTLETEAAGERLPE